MRNMMTFFKNKITTLLQDIRLLSCKFTYYSSMHLSFVICQILWILVLFDEEKKNDNYIITSLDNFTSLGLCTFLFF